MGDFGSKCNYMVSFVQFFLNKGIAFGSWDFDSRLGKLDGKSGLMEDQSLWQNEGALGRSLARKSLRWIWAHDFSRRTCHSAARTTSKGVLEGRNSSMPLIGWVKKSLHRWIYTF